MITNFITGTITISKLGNSYINIGGLDFKPTHVFIANTTHSESSYNSTYPVKTYGVCKSGDNSTNIGLFDYKGSPKWYCYGRRVNVINGTTSVKISCYSDSYSAGTWTVGTYFYVVWREE